MGLAGGRRGLALASQGLLELGDPARHAVGLRAFAVRFGAQRLDFAEGGVAGLPHRAQVPVGAVQLAGMPFGFPCELLPQGFDLSGELVGARPVLAGLATGDAQRLLVLAVALGGVGLSPLGLGTGRLEEPLELSGPGRGALGLGPRRLKLGREPVDAVRLGLRGLGAPPHGGDLAPHGDGLGLELGDAGLGPIPRRLGDGDPPALHLEHGTHRRELLGESVAVLGDLLEP